MKNKENDSEKIKQKLGENPWEIIFREKKI